MGIIFGKAFMSQGRYQDLLYLLDSWANICIPSESHADCVADISQTLDEPIVCAGTQPTVQAKSYNFETESLDSQNAYWNDLQVAMVKGIIGIITYINYIQDLCLGFEFRRDYPLPYYIFTLGLGGIIPYTLNPHCRFRVLSMIFLYTKSKFWLV